MQIFNYHTHTSRCGHADNDYTPEDYVKDFIKAGFKKMAFTDHAPYPDPIDKRPKIRMDYKEKDDYLNDIKLLQEKYNDDIEIKTGVEAEYTLQDEEYLKEIRKEYDILILGQHYIEKNNQLVIWGKTECTDEDVIDYAHVLEYVMKNKLVDIIAHPDFYLFSRKEFGEADRKLAHIVGKAAEESGVPLEINLNNIFHQTYFKDEIHNNDSVEVQIERLKNVLYPNNEFWKIISEYNVNVVFGGDVHHSMQIEHLHEFEKFAEIILGKETINKLNFVEDI